MRVWCSCGMGLVLVGSPPERQKVFLVEGNVKEEQNA